MIFRFSFNKDADIVSKKYRYAGFSCQNIRQLTELIIVVTKNPAENPAKTLTESITNQSNEAPPFSPHTRKVYKPIEVRLRLFFADLIDFPHHHAIELLLFII